MKTLDRSTSQLLVIDIQGRLMPVIDRADTVIRNTRRLLDAAAIFDMPVLFTEQYPKGLGPTVPEVLVPEARIVAKMSFDACRTEGFLESLSDRSDIVVAGCEAHVCVLQTVLGLLSGGRRVIVVEDALGARQEASKAAALSRMARCGAEIVTTEMVVFEWLETATHPRFKEVVALIK